MTNSPKEKTKTIVSEAYAKIAKGEKDSCGCVSGSDFNEYAKSLSYTEEELKTIPKEANLGLSCGNPTATASLKEGETVLDLGSGAGFDCFLAAAQVGSSGKVIGIDMTAEMIEKAKENAKKRNAANIEFRLGEIENLPVQDNSIDVVISNCVINLSADKLKVFKEIYRVLKPGGRIVISDMALLKELPKKIKESIEAYVGCISGASLVDDYKKMVEAAGLKDVKIAVKNYSCVFPNSNDPIGRSILEHLEKGESLQSYVVSVYVEGHKD